MAHLGHAFFYPRAGRMEEWDDAEWGDGVELRHALRYHTLLSIYWLIRVRFSNAYKVQPQPRPIAVAP
jgi:hypothetical protein